MDLSKMVRPQLAQVVNMFVALVEVMLALRVVLKFFFTTAGGSFFHWAFSTTNVLLAPFRGVYPNPTMTPDRWYIDWVALFAMAVYVAFGALLVSLVTWGFGTKKR